MDKDLNADKFKLKRTFTLEVLNELISNHMLFLIWWIILLLHVIVQ